MINVVFILCKPDLKILRNEFCISHLTKILKKNSKKKIKMRKSKTEKDYLPTG